MSLGELYVPGESWAHRADPRVKLAFVVVGAVLLLAYNNLALMLLALAALLAGLRAVRVPWPRLQAIWRLVLPVAILIPLLWPVFYQAGPVLVSWWRLQITAWATAQGFVAAARIVALSFLTASLFLTTDMRSLLRALVHLGLSHEGALVVTIALSYIPRMQRTYEQVTEAQTARGFDLNAGSIVARARARVPVLVAALVSTFRTADTLSRALECRGFGRRDVARTSLFDIRWRPTDTLLAAAVLLLGLAALYARFALGIGAHPVFLR